MRVRLPRVDQTDLNLFEFDMDLTMMVFSWMPTTESMLVTEAAMWKDPTAANRLRA